MLNKSRFLIIATVAGVALGAAATALAADGGPAKVTPAGADLLERANLPLDEAVEMQRLRANYRKLHSQADAAGVAPKRLELDETVGERELRGEIKDLKKAIRRAEESASVAGVPRATLEAIAACESGGDPSAIGGGGAFRGKYQFMTGTWAAVGGSGDPAAAPEAEQDYRAALLYKRSGSSPWPVCGQ